MADSSRLLTPGQVQLALQLARLGVQEPEQVASVLNVPVDRVVLSFRLTQRHAFAELVALARVPIRPAAGGGS